MRRSTLALTAAAMLAFAGNSLLCRAALGAGLIDAASFMSVRTISAAALLAAIVAYRRQLRAPRRQDLVPAAALFIYMITFSFAYASLSTGTGALILFGVVQCTMISAALLQGERLPALAWLGFVVAVAGLCWLVAPGITAPDPTGAVLMGIAGIGWGVYSLKGRSSGDAAASTFSSFGLIIVPILIVAALVDRPSVRTAPGIALAVASGAITSGLGYIAWYRALPHLTAAQASSVQLTVPALAAALGVLLLAEAASLRLLLASAATIGGVALVIAARTGRGDRRATPR